MSPARLPLNLLKGERTVEGMKPGEKGFISSGAVVVDPKTREMVVWAEADVGTESLVDGLVYVTRGKNGVSLHIPGFTRIKPREQDEDEDYIPVDDLKVVDYEEWKSLSPATE